MPRRPGEPYARAPAAVLSRDQIRRLLEAVDDNPETGPRDKAILGLAYELALKMSEVIYLQAEDLDFETKRVHIDASHGHKERYVPLTVAAKAILTEYEPYRKYSKGSPWLFFMPRTGEPPYPAQCTMMWKRGLAKAGFPNISSSSLRYSKMAHMRDDGFPDAAIRIMIGQDPEVRTIVSAIRLPSTLPDDTSSTTAFHSEEDPETT